MLPSGGSELVALCVVGALTVGARFIFRPSRSRTHRVQRINASDARELGLLSVIATVPRAKAATQREQLRRVGIRASTSLRDDGRFDLLVFDADADRARDVLAD